MLWDTHMHTTFSGDGKAAPADMIEAAIQKQLPGICFTEHLDLDYPGEPELFLLDLPAYRASLERLRDAYSDRLPVRFGIELGLQPHLAAEHTALLARYPFDFVIGSSHVVHGADPYYLAFYEGRTEEECYREYFSSILENIRAFDGFDVYGHIDYVVRYGPNQDKNYSFRKYQDLIDPILTALFEGGKATEINTGGFFYGLLHPNPTEDIITRYRALGGEIITIGSDAHDTAHVAFAFERVTEILKSCGFSYYTVFRKRKPEFIRL